MRRRIEQGARAAKGAGRREEPMTENNQKLEHFTATILNEAAAESEQAQTDFQARREQALTEARKAARLEARAYVRSELGRIRADAGHQVSYRMQESKRTLFQRRNQIAGEVFDAVRRKIAAYTATPEYGRRLEDLLRQALGALAEAETVQVYLRPADRGFIPLLQEAAPEVHMTFLDGAFTLGGLIVEAPACGLRVDSSFDSRMDELNGHFAELFGISLSDAEG
jgi:vacuolar-type H+-ATPase subunit E/Vma4